MNQGEKDRNKKLNDEWAKNVGDFALLLDSIAAGENLGYALVTDLVTAVCEVCYVPMVAGYQIYSYLPNATSTVAMGPWFGQGELQEKIVYLFCAASLEKSAPGFLVLHILDI